MTEPAIEAVIFDLGRVLVAIDDRLLTERLFKGLDAADSHEVARATIKTPRWSPSTPAGSRPRNSMNV